MTVSLVILTHNRVGILEELLQSILPVVRALVDVIVVDNASSDGTESLVKDRFPQVKYLRMPENVGVGGRNAGIMEAKGELVVTLDDDVLGLTEASVKSIIEIFESRPEVGAICFKVVDFSSGELCNWCHHCEKEIYGETEFVTDEISEGAVVFKRDAVIRAGMYAPEFFISHEGADLLLRLLGEGYLTIYSPRVCVQHKHALNGRPAWRRYYYDTRNQIWLAIRNYPLLMGTRYLMRGLSAMFVYAARDGYVVYWGRGIWDGIRKIPSAFRNRKPLSGKSLEILSEVASRRPSLAYLIRRRLFTRGIRL